MTGATGADWTVLVLVLGARLVVPLLIGRFPLPAILASLAIDGVDKSVFQAFTGLDLASYQSYDKALDVYYLAITYLAVLRNWRDRFAVGAAAALWYYRLVGVLLFELTGTRWVLLVFPNTFEYLVVAVEVVRTRWDQRRLSRRTVVALTVVIWVVVKLPQEWWIHVAQLDFTDEFKSRVLGVEPERGWGAGFAHRPWAAVLILVVVVVLVVLGRRLAPRLPAAYHPFRLDGGPVPVDGVRRTVLGPPGSRAGAVTVWAVCEKAVLAGLVTAVLASSYPRVDVRWWAVGVVVAGTVVVHAGLDVARLRSGRRGPSGAAVQLAWNMGVSLVAIAVLAALVSGGRVAGVAFGDALLLAYVVALVTTLYDRWASAAWVRAARPGE